MSDYGAVTREMDKGTPSELICATCRDTMGQMCPVFALRLAGPDGRGIADSVRAQMREWSA